MNQNLHLTFFTFLLLTFFVNRPSSAATFTSAQNGSWFDANTWAEAGYPTSSDDVLIKDGHTVMITGSFYIYYGDITIEEQGELVVDAGNYQDGLVYSGHEFHVFGKLTFTSDKDFSLIGDSHFWGHPGAEIWVTDDWKVSQNTVTTVESICVRVDDDFHIKGTNAIVCGAGGVSIGSSSHNNTFNLQNGATSNQVCNETTVYRSSNSGQTCDEVVKGGTGNSSPQATDDTEATTMDVPVKIYVLTQGIADTDSNNDDLTIISAGTNYTKNEQTTQGGSVSINDNETPSDPTDDFIDYTPPSGFVGTDDFIYVISDGNGGFDYATVTVNVSPALPVELVTFRGKEKACKVNLSWATAAELNNSHFEIERSVDGYRFNKIGRVKGSGTSSQYHVYDFADALPTRENYYRLKQVDYDGTSTYSEVIFISSECAANNDNIGLANVFPNPVMNGEINIRFNANLREDAILTISDLYGKNILRQEVNVEEGLNNFHLNIDELQAGTYLLTLGRQSTKFIKTLD